MARRDRLLVEDRGQIDEKRKLLLLMSWDRWRSLWAGCGRQEGSRTSRTVSGRRRLVRGRHGRPVDRLETSWIRDMRKQSGEDGQSMNNNVNNV